MATVSGVRVGHPAPAFDDARFINKPVLILDGGTDNFPIQNKWIRVQLIMEQSSTVARKASKDMRPMGPPTFILMNLYQVHHSVNYDDNDLPIEPPPNCPETLIPATDDLSTFFVCVPSLFRVHPPSREEELGRVLRTRDIGGEERVRARKGDLYSSAGRDYDDPVSDGSAEEDDDPEDALQNSGFSSAPSASASAPAPYPYPATAISCHDPKWPESVAAARDQARQHWPLIPNQPCPVNHGRLPVGEDVSAEEMAWIQEHLPREDLKFVRTQYGFEDMRSRLKEVNNRKGCFVLNGFSTGSKGFVFVFDNMLLQDEGYWAIRFALCNIGWTAHPVYRSGESSYGFLADVYTGAIGVYSSKQWPKLPPTSKVTEHYAAQIKLCHRMQPSTKDQSKRPSNQLVNVTTRGKETAAAAKRPRRRQTPRPPRLRRKATEIRRGFREVRGDPSVPPPQWVGDLERTSGDRDGEMEVARTEPCSPALSALIMATAGRSPQSHGNGVQSSLHGDFSQAPWLLYPTPSSISMSLPSQDQPVVTDAMMRTAEALLSRPTSSPSHASHPGRPRHQSLPPISPSSPPMTHPPYGSSSVRLTPPRPSFLARSLSWMQHPLAGQAASAYASSRPDLGIQAHQPHSQEGYIIDYPHPNQYHQQALTAYTEDYHHLKFDSGQPHMDHPPSVNPYSSPTSTDSFTPAAMPMHTTKYPPARDEAGN